MSAQIKILLSAAALAVIFCVAASADVAAVASPRLEVVPSRDEVGVGYTQAAATEGVATRIEFAVPDGFEFTPDAGGAATGLVIGSDVIMIRGSQQPLTGVLTLENPASFAAEGLTCTGRPKQDGVWAASVPSPTGALKIPIFVAGRTFTICPDPGRLGGTPTAISLQLSLVSNSGINRALVHAPSAPGRYVWRVRVVRSGQQDVEVRSIVDLPQRASFKAKVAGGTLRITGRVTGAARGVAGVGIEAVVASRQSRGFTVHGHTRGDGRLTLVHRIARGTFVVRVTSAEAQRDATISGCTAPSTASGGCISATYMILGMQATPASVRVRRP